ncbi:MAG: ABC transporter permease [Gammaproteobacteria bacterium]|nr:ABC transporter permease [Gammaproteobacteria bacterium]
MEIRPILSAMLRNKTGAVLVSLQIAITLAIIVNAAFIVAQRIEKINRPVGLPIGELIFIGATGFGDTYNHRESIRQDLETLRAMPGVVSASTIRGVPLSGGGSSTGHHPSDDPESQSFSGNYYFADETTAETLGLKIIAGRWFREDEILWQQSQDEPNYPETMVLSKALAEDLFGEEDAVGKNVYSGTGKSATVVGVYERMLGAWVNWERLDRTLFYARVVAPNSVNYVVRANPGDTDRLVAEIEEALGDANRERIVRWVYPHEYFINRSYSRDRAMLNLLATVITLLVIITGLGIVGLVAFNVNQRRKQIGTRRALGARQFHILRYFLVENWLITTMGLTLGVVLTFTLSYWLGVQYELPKLDWRYLPIAIAFIWALGLTSAFGPARRAAVISPAIATRNV